MFERALAYDDVKRLTYIKSALKQPTDIGGSVLPAYDAALYLLHDKMVNAVDRFWEFKKKPSSTWIDEFLTRSAQECSTKVCDIIRYSLIFVGQEYELSSSEIKRLAVIEKEIDEVEVGVEPYPYTERHVVYTVVKDNDDGVAQAFIYILAAATWLDSQF